MPSNGLKREFCTLLCSLDVEGDGGSTDKSEGNDPACKGKKQKLRKEETGLEKWIPGHSLKVVSYQLRENHKLT